MIKLKALTTNKDAMAQHLLSQVDNIGLTLNQLGIKNNINRHALVSQAWVQKHRIEGELARLDLLVHTSLRPLIKARKKIDQTIDTAIDYLPQSLAKRAHKTHSTLMRMSGGSTSSNT
ncbi:MAG TPA: hypothetical protein DHW71_14600 [Gammaproteobacteria bacterium]|nr:hypothetical protein [Gammaproteobacteria bacterium]MEC8009607.1 hypothetical protein [Pseudomonadota bacterium]HBF09567.1 hypothetical protein [Gammaproteobacteria bacterium]HCK94222.1 hypothetical protein [Gammaproteobacteria bacterium]|tara:strand:- start:810 stop:1163 length:354 start_codon:yes stop_codon:yes gene_type:complete